MARLIEIKGLGDAVASAKKGISDLKTAAGSLNASTGLLVAEINDLTEQVEQHRADLKFEAETLGNSPATSEKQAVTSSDVGKIEDVIPLQSGSVGVTEPRA